MAAKAMERPKTIWISRRKPPDDVAEGERQAGDDDDDDGDNLGDRTLDRIPGSAAAVLPTACRSRPHGPRRRRSR